MAIVYDKYEKRAWVDYEKEIDSSDLDIEDLANNIKFAYEKYPKTAIVAFDYGGLGSRLAQVLRTRYGIPGILPAIKKDKMAHLEEMRAEAYRGRLLFKKKPAKRSSHGGKSL